MSNLADKVAKFHEPMDKTLLRVLSLILGFMHVGLVMWDPEAYHQAI
ncbi:cytochrome bd biosynthesis protein, partial [Vibrio parahaemolyticus]